MKGADVVHALAELNDEPFSAQGLMALAKVVPTDDEVRDIQRFAKSADEDAMQRLGGAEQFVLAASKLPAMADHIELLVLKATLDGLVQEMRLALNDVAAACDALRNSTVLKELLAITLALGYPLLLSILSIVVTCEKLTLEHLSLVQKHVQCKLGARLSARLAAQAERHARECRAHDAAALRRHAARDEARSRARHRRRRRRRRADTRAVERRVPRRLRRDQGGAGVDQRHTRSARRVAGDRGACARRTPVAGSAAALCGVCGARGGGAGRGARAPAQHAAPVRGDVRVFRRTREHARANRLFPDVDGVFCAV